MVFLMEITKRSGNKRYLCFKVTRQNRHVWQGAVPRLNKNPLIMAARLVPL